MKLSLKCFLTISQEDDRPHSIEYHFLITILEKRFVSFWAQNHESAAFTAQFYRSSLMQTINTKALQFLSSEYQCFNIQKGLKVSLKSNDLQLKYYWKLN